MAGSQISTSVTIINSLLGFHSLSLTEMETSAESSIAAGSIVEIGSAFFVCSTETSISGFSSITTAATAYIEITPSGTAGAQTITAAWSETVPVWVDAKQGWYASATSIVRVVGGCVKTGTTSAEHDFLLKDYEDRLQWVELEIGDWDMDTNSSLNLSHGIGDAWDTIRAASCVVRTDATATNHYPLDRAQASNDGDNCGSISSWDSTQFVLRRTDSKLFDSSSFNQTSYNRGWVTFQWEAVAV